MSSLLIRPLKVWLKALSKVGLTTFVAILPMVYSGWFFWHLELCHWDGVVLFLEVINWWDSLSVIMNLYLIILGPVLVVLLPLILTLESWWFVEPLVVSPVHLLLCIHELWKLLAVNSNNLVSKFLGHVAYHILDSVCLDGSNVVSVIVNSLVCICVDGVLSVFESRLTIDMRVKIGFTGLQLLNESLFLCRSDVTSFVLVRNPLQGWRWKSILVVIISVWLKTSSCPPVHLMLVFLLVHRCILWVFNVVLRAVVILELNLL